MRAAFAATAFAAIAAAAPSPLLAERQSAINDGVILNYALTLEHLENAFYKEGLQKLSEEEFKKAGVEEGFYGNLKEISKDEQTHVTFLSTALGQAGVKAVKPCTYNFGFKDAATFLAIANVLEGVGVSAYLGAAKFIANKDYLTAAGAILTVEARHSAYLRNNQSPAQSPFPFAFDIPLGFNQVFSLASLFITGCPQDNPPLPVVAFPALSVTAPAGVVKVGDKLTVKAAKDVKGKEAYFVTFAGPVKASLSGYGKDYKVVVPTGAQPGQGYLILTKGGAPTDDNTVAGPAVVQIADNAYGAKYGHKYGHGGKDGYGKPEGY